MAKNTIKAQGILKGTYMGDNAKKKVKITTEEKARQDCESAGITDLDFIKEWEAYRYKRNVKVQKGTNPYSSIQEHYQKWKQKRDNGIAPVVISKELKVETTVPAQEPVDTEPEPEPDDTADKTTDDKPSNLKWWLIGGGIGLALIIAVIIIIILCKRKQ
ncbi:MAG: hypothetical protein IIT61_03225 [Bacteroidales bacterium]|nr:hypothetical protein [Bacteroidales bacterium]MBQ2351232.1 hypothetical protein [Bacteroidales bacterium]MBQ2573987.1 hypothetical protein [Bacteroidales bacterium]MBQ5424923.1 hypothetical protein [Bacteroidales bacterium]MBQ5457715.1 hypothetical protein [Bacteroidales bacterium]